MKTHQLLAMIFFVATSAMATDCPQPVNLKDGWEVAANMQEAGFDAVALCAVLTEIDSDKNANNMHAILVARRGQLIADLHFFALTITTARIMKAANIGNSKDDENNNQLIQRTVSLAVFVRFNALTKSGNV